VVPAAPWTHLWFGQAAQAAVDLHARLLQPIHWAKFVEANQPWNEPIEKLLPASEKLGVPLNVPRIGEPYTLAIRLRIWFGGILNKIKPGSCTP